MGIHYITTGRAHVVLTAPNIYSYKGFLFENTYWSGPVKLNKNLEQASRTGRKFYSVFEEWEKLSKEQKAQTLIYS